MNPTYDHLVDVARRNTYQKRDVFDTAYLSDFRQTLQCIGPSLSKSRTGLGNASQMPDCAPHDEVTLMLAGDAISQLDIANYRVWSDAEGSGYTLKLMWERVLWRYVCTYPIGFICARTSVKRSKSDASWSPALLDLPTYDRKDQCQIEFSERHIDGGCLSYGTYTRLFEDDDFSKNPMLSLALADAFAYKPNPDNPLVISLRRALKKKVVNNEALALPFWWAFAANYLLAHDETVLPVATHFRRDQRTGGVVDLSSTPNLKPAGHVPAPAPPSDTIPAAAVDAIVRLCRSLFASGQLKVNGARADFHVTDGALHAVYPLLFDKLAASMGKDSIDTESVVTLFQSAGLLADNEEGSSACGRFAFLPPGAQKPVGTTKLLRLSANAQLRLLSPEFVLEANPDIVALPAADRAEGGVAVPC